MTKGWKTAALGLAVFLISVFSGAELKAFVAEHLPEVGGALGTIVIVLRAFTNSPIFKKSE